MAEITEYEMPKAIQDAPTCKCSKADRKVAIVKRRATIVYDDETRKPNEVIALTFCSECGTYISKTPMTDEEYRKWKDERQRERKARENSEN